MPAYYTYLISSLPMLHFEANPPFSFDKFLQLCQGIIPGCDIGVIKSASLTGEYAYQYAQPTLDKWRIFDTALRNELVKIRASRKHIDPQKYLRQDGYAEPDIIHIAMNAYRNTSIIEAERMLDQARWRRLDELAVGHYFDIDFLIVYAHKLLILERWKNIRGADKPHLLEGTLPQG